MNSPPFRRRGPKIGRNEPCPCGSGRKFKDCHYKLQHTLPALLTRDKAEKAIIEKGRRLFERHKAKELQRQKQQGLGRPIISTEHEGYRFVAVGEKFHYGKWKTFFDFLANYVKHTLSLEWGQRELAKPLEECHPIMQWHEKIRRLREAHSETTGEVVSLPVTGATLAYYRIAYNLYLIAHNGKDIQIKLIERLKNADNFQGAYFETQVAAWLIKAGFELEFEDESDRSSKHCEFTATHVDTGEKYSVEAKSRELDPSNSSRAKVGRKLYQALEKDANHQRLVFLDLNKPLHSVEAVERAVGRAELIIRRSEGMVIDGNPAPEAYVCTTNMNHQYALDTSSIMEVASYSGFKKPDFMAEEYPSLREAARARERHWPIFQLLKSMEDHRDIPQTFDGELPSAVFGPKSQPRLQIGNQYSVPGPDGVEVVATLIQASVAGDRTYGIVLNPATGKSFMVTFDMTEDELSEYENFPDTYFGVYQKQSEKVETAMDLFDFHVGAYRDTPKERMLEYLSKYPDQDELKNMSQKDLVELFAELHSANMIAQGFAVKSRRKNRRGPRPK